MIGREFVFCEQRVLPSLATHVGAENTHRVHGRQLCLPEIEKDTQCL
jgi:hypothetical protein